MKHSIISYIIIFVAAVAFSFGVRSYFDRSRIDVENQSIGTSIFVKSLNLKKSGFILIEPFYFSIVEQPVFIKPPVFMPAGKYNNFHIDITEMSAYLSTSSGVLIRIYKDNGDEGFSKTDDKKAKDWKGNDYVKVIKLQQVNE